MGNILLSLIMIALSWPALVGAVPNCQNELLASRSDYTRLVESALNKNQLTVADLESLLASSQPVDPFAYVAPTSSNAALRGGFKKILSKNMDWPKVQVELSAVIAERKRQKGLTEKASDQTQHIFEPYQYHHGFWPEIHGKQIYAHPNGENWLVSFDGLHGQIRIRIRNLENRHQFIKQVPLDRFNGYRGHIAKLIHSRIAVNSSGDPVYVALIQFDFGVFFLAVNLTKNAWHDVSVHGYAGEKFDILNVNGKEMAVLTTKYHRIRYGLSLEDKATDVKDAGDDSHWEVYNTLDKYGFKWDDVQAELVTKSKARVLSVRTPYDLAFINSKLSYKVYFRECSSTSDGKWLESSEGRLFFVCKGKRADKVYILEPFNPATHLSSRVKTFTNKLKNFISLPESFITQPVSVHNVASASEIRHFWIFDDVLNVYFQGDRDRQLIFNVADRESQIYEFENVIPVNQSPVESVADGNNRRISAFSPSPEKLVVRFQIGEHVEEKVIHFDKAFASWSLFKGADAQVRLAVWSESGSDDFLQLYKMFPHYGGGR